MPYKPTPIAGVSHASLTGRGGLQPIEPNAEFCREVHVHETIMPSDPYVMQDIWI